MAYRLGIDLGTTYTAAAIVENGRASIVPLGNRAPVVPTVVFLREDDTILTGDTANRRAITEPGRVAREFKRRVGDPTPLLLGGSPMSAQSLVAKMLRWTVDHVAQLQGGPPEVVALSRPANWGPFKLDLLDQAIRMADLEDAVTLTEPEAAAIYYASTERLDVGQIVAVYDLGGGTFDAAVLRKTDVAFEILGTPEGIEHLGGIDIDEAVYAYVGEKLGGALNDLDPDDPATIAGVARLKADCVEAKEALSVDNEVTIPVLLPSVQTEVKLSRADFEAKVRPSLQDTIAALRRALRSASIEPADVAAVLLVGGSSRIPLVARMVSEELGRPVAVDAHPKHAVALGTALAAEQAVSDDPGVVPDRVTIVTPPPTPSAADSAPAAEVVTRPGPSEGRAAVGAGAGGSGGGSGGGSKRGLVFGGVAVGLLAVVGGALALSGGGGNKEPGGATTTTSTTVATTASNLPTTTTLPAVAVGTSGRGVRIDAITVTDGAYSVDYRTAGYTPQIANDRTKYHIHFFWNTVSQENAGTNGPQPGAWILYDVPSPFTQYKVSQRPSNATQMCALVADFQHGVELNTGNCVDLPAS